MVTWTQRTISFMMLVVLVGLPVAGTLCAALCSAALTSAADDRASAHHHHHASDVAPDAWPDSTSIMIGDVSAHDCGSHYARGQDSAITPVRADGNAVFAPLGLAAAQNVFFAVTIFIPVVADSPPSATTPPTSTPVVLRV